MCRSALKVNNNTTELEAAHIVPRNLRGADDVRNGLGLCRRHHWAFDKGLFGLDDARRVIVPANVKSIKENEPLAAFSGTKILQPLDPKLAPSAAAIKWHREHILGGGP